MCPATRLMPNRWHGGWLETHGEYGNLPKGPGGGPKPPEAASLRPHGSHTIRVAAWHLELLFGGPGRGGDTAARA